MSPFEELTIAHRETAHCDLLLLIIFIIPATNFAFFDPILYSHVKIETIQQSFRESS